MNKPIAVLMLSAAACAPMVASADDDKSNHGYGGGGLMLSSGTFDFGSGSVDSGGAGLGFTGAGIFDLGAVGVGVTGGLKFGTREEDQTDFEVTEAVFQVDGGLIVVDHLYISLGVHSFSEIYDGDEIGTGTDVTLSHVVIPVGVGFVSASDGGYILGQVRFGPGTWSEDFNDTEEDLGYFGIRVQGQVGMENGVQFMGAFEIDSYDFKDSNVTYDLVRLIVGVGFGT